MSCAVVIGSYRGSPWLQQCIDSIPSNLPTIVVRAYPYEPGALRWVMENTTLDRWLFLQDSTRVKDPSWIYENWSNDESIACNAEPRCYGSYLGFWKRSVLAKCHIPPTQTKIDAVLAEMNLPEEYARHEGVRILWPEFNLNCAVPETMFAGTHHERLTMRYENDHLIKWKSAFNGDTAAQAQARDDRNRQINP